jgi:hypothetical protein
MHDTTVFRIGGVDIDVPALNLFVMMKVKDELLALGPNLDWVSYAVNVVHIVYASLKDAHPEMLVGEDDFLKSCSLAEMRELAGAMNRLLDVSGFDAGDPSPNVIVPAKPESPGTGTSEDSSPNSQPTESAVETPTS